MPSFTAKGVRTSAITARVNNVRRCGNKKAADRMNEQRLTEHASSQNRTPETTKPAQGGFWTEKWSMGFRLVFSNQGVKPYIIFDLSLRTEGFEVNGWCHSATLLQTPHPTAPFFLHQFRSLSQIHLTTNSALSFCHLNKFAF